MKKYKKQPLTMAYKIPRFLFEEDTRVQTTRKKIYAVNSFKKMALICDTSYKNKYYFHFWELDKINDLRKGKSNEN